MVSGAQRRLRLDQARLDAIGDDGEQVALPVRRLNALRRDAVKADPGATAPNAGHAWIIVRIRGVALRTEWQSVRPLTVGDAESCYTGGGQPRAVVLPRRDLGMLEEILERRWDLGFA